MTLAPQISGTAAIRATEGEFAGALGRRLEAGLLSGRRDRRSNYRIISTGPKEVRFSAADWPTAINVGLNDVRLFFSAPGFLRYEVRFWRWAAYVLILSGVFLVAGIAALLFLDVRGYIAHSATSAIPGLSLDQNLIVLWGIVLFWGAMWPWLLIAIHKRPLRRLVVRLVAEVDAEANPSRPR